MKPGQAMLPDLDRLEPLVRADHAFDNIDSNRQPRRRALRHDALRVDRNGDLCQRLRRLPG